MKVARGKRLLNIYCIFATLAAYSLFLKCYFPVKKGLGGYATVKDVPPEPISGRGGVPEPSYGRLVLMVIDALRTDFLLGDQPYMPFTRKLLRDGQGVSFSAKTHLPTVTLPRIKAITTGSIPGFVDVVLNFGSTVLTDDNLMEQLKQAGKTLTFFGDDTWLNLFPHHFTRSDGTTSFYVTDYTEVDDNVTRHLPAELGRADWDVMTLHYLGLDHIGHLYGPTSHLVPPKLREMDDVVKQIYTSMQSWSSERPSLLVICGDHGMSDQGGHGGASASETHVPVVFLSPQSLFQPQQSLSGELQQIDLCPTLSALLGLPTPLNNLGRVEVGALPLTVPLRDRVRSLQINAAQLANVLDQNVDSLEEDKAYQLYQDVLAAHGSWLADEPSSTSALWESAGQRVLLGYQDAVRRMAGRISQTSATYDMYGIVLAILTLATNFLVQVLMQFCSNTSTTTHTQATGILGVFVVVLAAFTHVTVCTGPHSSDVLCSTSVAGLVLQLLMFGIVISNCVLLLPLGLSASRNYIQSARKPWSTPEVCLVVMTAVHSLSLLSSSFVEEEHQTWYFFTSSFHALLMLRPIAVFAAQSAQNMETIQSKPAQITKNLEIARSTETSKAARMTQNPDTTRLTRSQAAQINPASKSSEHSSSQGETLTSQDSAYSAVDSSLSISHDLVSPSSSPHDENYTRIRKKERNTETRVLYPLQEEIYSHEQRKDSTAGCVDTGEMQGPQCVKMVASLAGVLVLVRILRRWNQTGNKWLDVPDVGDWLVRPENKSSLSWLVVVSLLCLFFTRLRCLRGVTRRVLFGAALGSVYLSKAASGALVLPSGVRDCVSPQGVLEARAAYFFTLCLLIWILKPSKSEAVSNTNNTRQLQDQTTDTPDNNTSSFKNFQKLFLSEKNENNFQLMSEKHQDSVGGCDPTTDGHKASWEGVAVVWLSVMCLLLRPHNIAAVAMVSAVETLVYSCVLPWTPLSAACTLLYCAMMGQAAFFCQGNSNSLSTVDVTAGLTGLHDYQPVVIALQMTLSTYAGALFWLLTACKYVCTLAPARRTQQWLSDTYREVSVTALLTRALPLTVYTALVTVERHHLFVWTVFSPKLLYEGMLTLVTSAFCAICLLLARFVGAARHS